MIRAAIAIGSNSTRMLVADKTDGAVRNLCRGREETRLFLGLDAQGNIDPEHLENTAQAVKRLQTQARQFGAQEITLFATSATRDAANSDAFARRIMELTGLRLEIIPGEEEARLAFKASAGLERRLVIDIGGGSTEMTVGENGIIEYSGSAQMGAGRLAKMCPITSLEDAVRAAEAAADVLRPFAEKVRACRPAPQMIGLGGTCTAAVSIFHQTELHGEDADGKSISLDEVRRQWKLLAPMTQEERVRVPGLPVTRALMMPTGLCILLSVMELCGFDRITVSGRNNLVGWMMD